MSVSACEMFFGHSMTFIKVVLIINLFIHCTTNGIEGNRSLFLKEVYVNCKGICKTLIVLYGVISVIHCLFTLT